MKKKKKKGLMKQSGVKAIEGEEKRQVRGKGYDVLAKSQMKEKCKVEFVQPCVGFIPCQICL